MGSIPTQYASTFLPVQNSLAQVAPYNTLTPPVNFSTDYCLVLNNEEMNSNLLFDMFPNPVSSILQIRSTGIKKNHGEITYEIYNLNSSLIVKGNLNFEGDETTTLNVSRFQDGMYLLKIISDNRINLSKFHWFEPSIAHIFFAVYRYSSFEKRITNNDLRFCQQIILL